MISDLDQSLIVHMFEYASYSYDCEGSREISRLKNAMSLARAWLITHIHSEYQFIWQNDMIESIDGITPNEEEAIKNGSMLVKKLLFKHDSYQKLFDGILLMSDQDPTIKLVEAEVAREYLNGVSNANGT